MNLSSLSKTLKGSVIQNAKQYIERTCQEVLGYSDTDVVEYLYKKKPKLDALIKFTCKDLTGASSSKPQPVPKDLDLHRLFVEVTSRGRIAKVLKWIRKDKYWQNTLGFSVEPY